MTHALGLPSRCLVVAVVVFTGLARPTQAAEGTSPDSAGREQLRKVLAASIEQGNGSGAAQAAAADAGDELRRWLQAHAAALYSVRPGPLGEQPWGLSAQRPGEAPDTPARVYLYVFDWHASGKLVVYGLTGGVRKAYLFADANRAPLPASRLGSSTVFTVPKERPDPVANVVVLELAGEEPRIADIVAKPAAEDGRILLLARDAVVHGLKVRYEPEPHKNTVGYWTDPGDWVSWDLEITEPGKYAVEILQGCGRGSGGSRVDFAVDEQVLPVTVQDTGGFQNFVPRGIGDFTFVKPGAYTLSVKPLSKAGKAVMDLRSVTLTPVK